MSIDLTADPESIITLHGVSKSYPGAAGAFAALRDVSLQVQRGEFTAIAGASGSGKSTLLSLLAGIDRPTSGVVQVAGTRVDALSERQLTAWRGRTVGIVFQFFQLLPTLTVAENVALPMDLDGRRPARTRATHAVALLDRLGVADQADKFPSALSGGQQQRVAIARALANDAPVLLADEPTGNLDSHTAASILSLFGALARDGQTIVMVTHAPEALRHASRVLTLADGQLVREERRADA